MRRLRSGWRAWRKRRSAASKKLCAARLPTSCPQSRGTWTCCCACWTRRWRCCPGSRSWPLRAALARRRRARGAAMSLRRRRRRRRWRRRCGRRPRGVRCRSWRGGCWPACPRVRSARTRCARSPTRWLRRTCLGCLRWTRRRWGRMLRGWARARGRCRGRRCCPRGRLRSCGTRWCLWSGCWILGSRQRRRRSARGARVKTRRRRQGRRQQPRLRRGRGPERARMARASA
mmetsp:Transcript_16643/g.53101  ORF Transcript_16643/g.53101 Transcript_16643/m.53101 type:complete len:231 (+) Transcript_16643:1509-2201(+)